MASTNQFQDLDDGCLKDARLLDHSYSVRTVAPEDLPRLKDLDCASRKGPPPMIAMLVEKYSDFGTNVGMVEDFEPGWKEDEWNGSSDESASPDDGDKNKFESDEENVRKYSTGIELEEESKDVYDEHESAEHFLRQFSKCDKCRQSRTKVLVPNSVLSVAVTRNDGITCDFCGNRMTNALPQTLPNTFEGRRGSRGGDLIRNLRLKGQTQPVTEKDLLDAFKNKTTKKNKLYVYCGECGKVVLKESLIKHMRDVHQKSNKKECHLCSKVLSGPFSLKEHISAVHNKVARHQCPHCQQMFAHFSNMNRHVRLLHDKMVVTHKYVNCVVCSKVVQATSLKKHMETIHDRRKDFICSFCNKGFAQSYTLKEHTIAKHTHNFSHTCFFCRKSFAHKTNAYRHVRTVHKDQIDGHDLEGTILGKYVVSCKTEQENKPVERDQPANPGQLANLQKRATPAGGSCRNK